MIVTAIDALSVHRPVSANIRVNSQRLERSRMSDLSAPERPNEEPSREHSAFVVDEKAFVPPGPARGSMLLTAHTGDDRAYRFGDTGLLHHFVRITCALAL